MNNDIEFILTKEYKKFEEFCNSCKDYRYIGLCYGIPGIGKSLSALKYADWNEASNFYETNFEKIFKDKASLTTFPEIQHCDTILITASPTNTPSKIDKIISSEAHKLMFMKYFSVHKDYPKYNYYSDQDRFSEIKLLILDEVDHLKYTSCLTRTIIT